MRLTLMTFFIFNFASLSSALLCYECNNARTNEECLETGSLKNCVEEEAICEDQIRHEDEGKVIIIEKRCKQAHACTTNVNQNLRPAFPIQCHIGSPTSACRCCCSTDGCNKELLACWKAYPTFNMTSGKNTCDDFPSTPSNAIMQCDGNNQPGTTCEFKCHDGCYLVGNEKLTCLKNYTWDYPVPQCKYKKCFPKLIPPKNGRIKCNKRNLLRSRCEYKCRANYHLLGNRYALCQDTPGSVKRRRGRWSTTRTPLCKPLVCQRQGPMHHGGFKCTDRRKVGSTCRFQCQPKYILYPEGFETNRCQDNGRWNIPFPCCTLPCPPFAIVDLIIVLDSSSSVQTPNWKKMKTFVKTLLSNFTVREDAARFGVFRYNKYVDNVTQLAGKVCLHEPVQVPFIHKYDFYDFFSELRKILLSDYPHNKKGFFQAFDKIPYDGRGTNTGNALSHVANEMFKKGNRSLAPDVVLLITDGISKDNVTEPAQRVRDSGALMMVLPVKPPEGEIDMSQIYDIAGPGNRKNVLEDAVKGGFDALNAEFAARLSKLFCPAPCANPFHKHPGYTPKRLKGYGPK